jgi:hypothetical protein
VRVHFAVWVFGDVDVKPAKVGDHAGGWPVANVISKDLKGYALLQNVLLEPDENPLCMAAVMPL